MAGYKGLQVVAAVLLVSLAASVHAALGDAPDPTVELPKPSLELEPQDVVRIVIRALANNDFPFADAGIATTFGFASPANRRNTGPLNRFTRMVKSFPYGVMVGHVASKFSEVVYVGDNAYQLVHLTTRDGGEVVFAFRLSRQRDGVYAGMWMTDAVWPVGP